MILVIPMAGRGERFAKAGFETPKPLIEFEPGEPLFVRATRSFPLEQMHEIVFVILKEHCAEYNFDQEIRKYFGDYRIRIEVLDDVTSGQAETVAVALDHSLPDQELMVFNADSSFDCDISAWIGAEAHKYVGALQVFRDDQDRWSFAKVNTENEVIETAEKVPISDLASTGLYYFRSWKQYLEEYEQLEIALGEKFIAPIYNNFIRKGLKVGIMPCQKYFCFGTPEDFAACKEGQFYTY